jgi:hypothetical protein
LPLPSSPVLCRRATHACMHACPPGSPALPCGCRVL